MLLLITPCLTLAQKTKVRNIRQELSQARSYIKSKKNYDKAEQLMTRLLADTTLRHDKRIYLLWLDAVKGQYDQANERLYLNQRQDTAAFFALTRRMFTIAETLDSIEAQPNAKGKVKIEHRQKNSAMLSTYRPNLYNAGTYHLRKAEWQKGYDYMDTYIDCARQPLFEQQQYSTYDTRLADAAYWATYCAYRTGNAEQTLKHAEMALKDSIHTDFTLQFTCEAYLWKNDTLAYENTMLKGFRHNPYYTYFFPRLIELYNSNGRFNEALALADSALAVCDSCMLFLFAKSSTLLRIGEWQKSLQYSQRIIMLNDSMPDTYINAGTACVNIADIMKNSNDRQQAISYYQRARTYIEYYRQLMPNEQEKWAPLLYRIYLNLNLGRQFDEIDRLLRTP